MNAYFRIRVTMVALSAATFAIVTHAQDPGKGDAKSPCLKLVKWPGSDQSTPAICVMRNGWYFCMRPSELRKVAVSAPQLKFGDLLVDTKLLQIDPVHQVCLIESKNNGQPADTPIPISSTQVCIPGTVLTSMCPGNSCRTRIAGKDQHYQGKALPVPLLRVRVADGSICQPGTPLINSKGELEALLTDKEMLGNKEAHAIPAAALRKMLSDYEAFQKTGPVWIGAIFQSGETTLEVLEIRENSPASKGGIKVGDVVLSVAKMPVNNFPALLEVFQSLPAGKATTFKVLRGLDEKELSVVPEFVEQEK